MHTEPRERARVTDDAPRDRVGAHDDPDGSGAPGGPAGSAPPDGHDPLPAPAPSLAGGRAGLRELALVALAAVATVLVVVGPLPLDSPVVHRGDTFQHLALIESADWTGSTGATDGLGAPHGVDWSVFPTGGDRLHLVVLNAFDEVTGDAVAAMNLHVLLMLTVTAVVAHAALRRLGCSPPVAGAAAVVFALSPAALQRLAVGHLFLFGLFPVVLAVVVTLWAVDVPPPRSLHPRDWSTRRWLGRRVWALPVVAAALIGVSGAYFAVFSVLVLGLVAVAVAVRHGELRRLAAPMLVLLVLGGTTAASLAPDLLARRDDPAAASLQRPVSDSDSYGLRAAQLVLPRPDHPVEPLARWGERGERLRAPGDPGATLGLLGTAGLVCLAVTVLRRGGRARDRTDRTVIRLGAVAAAALVLATAGGGGFLLATLGLTQVRAWSRLVPFVLFCSLAALGLLVTRRTAGTSRSALLVIPVAVLALVDQGLWPADRVARDAAYAEDSALVEQLVDTLGAGASVAQLPVVSFPDDISAERLLAPAHHAEGRLRFTAGAFRGGAGDWQTSWLVDDPDRAVRAAAAAGFDALLVQRTHSLVEDPARLERELAAAAGEPLVHSEQRTWSWVDLRPLHRRLVEEHGAAAVDRAGAGVVRPVGVGHEGEVANDHGDGGVRTALGAAGALVLHDLDGGAAPVVLRLRVAAADGATVTIDTSEETLELRPGPAGRFVDLQVPMDGGRARVEVSTDGAPLRMPGSDGPARVLLDRVRALDAATTRGTVLDGP